MGLFGKIDEHLTEVQAESAENISIDLRLREGASLLIASCINKIVPTQQSPQPLQNITHDAVNLLMTDYEGNLQNNQILAAMDKEFLPQPAMLAHWAKSQGFQQIETDTNKLSPEAVADKYILTYYPPIPQSWAKRTGSDISDTTNKHWYSHTKSSLYDENGTLLGSSNPEAYYNDTEHDTTVYTPEDAVSYAVDYKKLGLKKEDIEEGFILQSEGMNIMDPNMQQAIFRLKDNGLSTNDILRLWQSNVDLTNTENLNKLERKLTQSQNKSEIFTLDYVKTNNEYHYNLQDRSCAIQPTAPILYATAAKIKHENLNNEQADALRRQIGLYNIYDETNYGAINHEFYTDFEQKTMQNLRSALQEKAAQLHEDPKTVISDFAQNVVNIAKWSSSKTLRWIPDASRIAYTQMKEQGSNICDNLKQHIIGDANRCVNLLSKLNILERGDDRSREGEQEATPAQINPVLKFISRKTRSD